MGKGLCLRVEEKRRGPITRRRAIWGEGHRASAFAGSSPLAQAPAWSWVPVGDAGSWCPLSGLGMVTGQEGGESNSVGLSAAGREAQPGGSHWKDSDG